jgi:hypothetical protein
MPHVDVGTVPTVEDVAKTTRVPNRVIRNLKITHSYASLAAAVRRRTGPAANWCTFATWASRQAGSTIRGEDLLARFGRCLGRRPWVTAPLQSLSRMLLRKGIFEPATALGRVIAEIHTPFDAFERASTAVAEGNLKVFEEIGREFARFLAEVPGHARTDSPEFLGFIAGLRPGLPPDGQEYLRKAFGHYVQRQHEADPAARAVLMLLANLEIGLHEQTRLQPEIAAAVDAPLITASDLGMRLLHVLIPASDRWRAAIRRPLAAVLGALAARVRREAVAVTRQVVTESMMVLTLPTGVLSLGCNLTAAVPPVFLQASDETLRSFERAFHECRPDGGDCAATDWCDLRQRMHYIIHLFRAYAEEPALFSSPFTPEQVACFESGMVPEGDL